MSSSSGAVLVVAPPRTGVFAALGKELGDAGFDVVTAPDVPRALPLLDREMLRAVLAPEGASLFGRRFQRLRQAAHGRGVPVVLVTTRKAADRVALPFAILHRADGEIAEGEIRTPGSVERAVRDAMERGPVEAPRPPRERLGEILLCAAGVSFLVVLAAMAWTFVAAVAWGGPQPSHGLRVAPWFPKALWGFLVAYQVSKDLGRRLVAGRRVRLGWGSWVVLALFALVLVLRAVMLVP